MSKNNSIVVSYKSEEDKQLATFVEGYQRPSGSLIPIKEYALMAGFDLKDVAQRKLANTSYDALKVKFSRLVKIQMVLSQSQEALRGTKSSTKRNKAGDITGFDFSLRVPSVKAVKAAKEQTLSELLAGKSRDEKLALILALQEEVATAPESSTDIEVEVETELVNA